jgi:hypothetical protein
MRKFGADLLNTPDGTTLIELTFFANEGGRGAGENPYMSVSGLFTDQRGNHPGHTAELRVEDKVGGPLRLLPPIVKGSSPAGLIET